MPWKDSQTEVILDEHEQLHRGSGRAGWGVMGYAILGVGILVLSGVILYLFLGQSMSEDSEQIRSLADRISGIENRLTMLETTSRGDDATAQRNKRVELFMGRFENLEATMAQRTADLAKRLEALESVARKPVPAPAQPVAAAPSPAKPVQTAPTTESVHVVAKGDTLYSISRKYGISVDELLSFNGMAPGAVIHPGQSLRVKAPSK